MTRHSNEKQELERQQCTPTRTIYITIVVMVIMGAIIFGLYEFIKGSTAENDGSVLPVTNKPNKVLESDKSEGKEELVWGREEFEFVSNNFDKILESMKNISTDFDVVCVENSDRGSFLCRVNIFVDLKKLAYRFF